MEPSEPEHPTVDETPLKPKVKKNFSDEHRAYLAERMKKVNEARVAKARVKNEAMLAAKEAKAEAKLEEIKQKKEKVKTAKEHPEVKAGEPAVPSTIRSANFDAQVATKLPLAPPATPSLDNTKHKKEGTKVKKVIKKKTVVIQESSDSEDYANSSSDSESEEEEVVYIQKKAKAKPKAAKEPTPTKLMKEKKVKEPKAVAVEIPKGVFKFV
jgi:hypothetical protein